MTELDWQQKVKSLLKELEKTAVKRDHIGKHPAKERQLIKELGLLDLIIEQKYGGKGLKWSEILQVIQDIATVDSAIAHILAFHYLQIVTIKLYGGPEQYNYFSQLTKDKNLFWGNALNPNDKRAGVTFRENKIIINGMKSYCSGSVGSDILLISAWHKENSGFLIGVTYSDETGVNIQEDWDAFGQKQTDSGTVVFENLHLNPEWVLLTPDMKLTPKQSVRSLLAQSVLTNLFIGLGLGALYATREFLEKGKKAWSFSSAELAIEDEFNQQHIAKLYVGIQAAIALDKETRRTIDDLLSRPEFSYADRGELAVKQMTSRIAAHEAVLNATSQVFEIMGASATTNQLGLDRLWRNARVHTLHDPINYKLKDLGKYFLSNTFPEITPYT